MFVAKRALIITREVKFSMNAKTGLEQHGYEVTTYTNSRPALDFLRQNAQHVALLDFRVNDMPATDVLDHMRAVQPDIAVVAAPDHPAVHNLRERYNLQAIINIPFPTRELLEVFEEAIKDMYDAQPDTKSSPVIDTSDTARIQAAAKNIEFWISDTDDGDTIVEYAAEVDEHAIRDELSTRNFHLLAQEEPPMPEFVDNSTVHDLREHLENPENIRRIVEVISDEDTTPGKTGEQSSAGEDAPEESKSIPAAMILETALDQSTPIRNFSIGEFIERVRERGELEIIPLPSWVEESERFIREPDFLPEELPTFTTSFEYTATPTAASEANRQTVEQDAADLVTDQLEPIKRSKPIEEVVVPELPSAEMEQPEPDGADSDSFELEMQKEIDIPGEVVDTLQPVIERPDAIEESAVVPEVALADESPEGVTMMPFTEHIGDSPYVAQLAVTLTQVSLELTADATLLARDGQIVAYAGRLPRSDIDDLREQLADDWDANGQKSRIRFITLPGSGMDYMLYTRQTESGFSLSMIFGGTIPLHVIRRQGKRLADALTAVPEIIPDAEPEAEEISASPIHIPSLDEIGERAPYAFVWMLHNAEGEIPREVASEIVKGLDVQLSQGGWQVHDISVHQDYIYLFGDMPASLSAQRIVRNLMNVSGDIIQDMFPALESETLWDPSYLVLHPGRELTVEEIQRFINFARG